MTIHFDTLEYSTALEKAGIERAHAEAIAKGQARALTDLVDHHLVTQEQLKSELTQVETRLRGEIREVETRLRGEIGETETRLRGEIGASENRLRAEISTVRGDMATLRAGLQDDFRKEIADLRVTLRGIQIGGAIGMFALSAIVLMSRLIK